MNFKKTVCTFMSGTVLSICLCLPSRSESVEKILKEPHLSGTDKVQSLISASRFTEFISSEKSKLDFGPYYIEDIKRLDSIFFWCFCILCYKNRLNSCIDAAVEFRNYEELQNDDKIFRNNKEEIIAKLKDNFDTSITGDELSDVYSYIMGKRMRTQKYHIHGSTAVEFSTHLGITRRQFVVQRGKKRKTARLKATSLRNCMFNSFDEDSSSDDEY